MVLKTYLGSTNIIHSFIILQIYLTLYGVRGVVTQRNRSCPSVVKMENYILCALLPEFYKTYIIVSYEQCLDQFEKSLQIKYFQKSLRPLENINFSQNTLHFISSLHFSKIFMKIMFL